MRYVLFAHPEWLELTGATLIVAGLALLFVARRTMRRRRMLLGEHAPGEPALSDAVLWVSLFCIAIGLLGPRLGERSVTLTGSGADIVLLLDVSRSMDAADTPPSRLHRARRAAHEILQRLPPDSRVALSAFSGRGVLLTPLTPDTAALDAMLPALDSELIAPGGSDLSAGVEAALAAFDETSQRPRVLLVLGDGEISRRDEAGSIAAERLGVRVLAAAFGSPLGTTVPDHGVPLRNAEGEIVVSRRQTASLEGLANATEGLVFVADEWGALEIDALLRELARDAASAPGEPIERRLTVPVILPFAALAFALLFLESLVSPISGTRPARVERRGTSARFPQRKAGVAAALSAGLGLVLVAAAPEAGDREQWLEEVAAYEALARIRSLSARELVALGVARAHAGDLDGGDHALRSAALGAEDPKVAAVAYFDLGVTALERGELESARELFFDSLALSPEDARARFNLEWTIAALDRPEPPPTPPRPSPSAETSEQKNPTEESTAEPKSEPEATPQEKPRPKARPESRPEAMDEERAKRWLDRLEDDPTRALRSAVQDGESPRSNRRRELPTW